MQRSTILFYLFLISSALLLYRCAKPVSPQGGAKDLKPPVVTACEPLNFSTKFNVKTFRIDFNEFISIKNPVTEIFISPPLRHPLDPKLRGKSLVVKIEDSLAANTTYSITFGNAIIDLTEGNIMKGFNYVFSTGDFIDTLSLQGNLQTAFDHKPQKDVFVELYINNNDTLPFDSLPLKVAPYYITKTDDQGNFMFHNLQHEQFKLFALADQNGDLVFNQPSEKIAFYDTLARPYYMAVPKPDTSQKVSPIPDKKKSPPARVKLSDSLNKIDSTREVDSIRQNNRQYPNYSLFLFEETDSVQRLLHSTFPKRGLAMLVFRFPVSSLRVVPLNFDSIAPWYLEEDTKNRDTVRLWITRPDVDSLVAKVFIGNQVLDTVRLEVTKKEIQKKSNKKEKPEQLGISNSAAGVGLNQLKNKLVVTFSYPLSRWDFTRVLLITVKDTIHPKIVFADSLKRKIFILHKWEEDKSYKILIPDSVFFGIHDISHDSVLMEFRTKGEKDFGNLIVTMNMEKRPGQYIIQLMNDRESTVFEEQVITGSGKIHFDFMPPGKYKLKAINDRNRNKRWDTGNYRLHLQPEDVIYFPKPIEIRANWDVEETWD
ncbi:MAG: Ig-like domain-containing protein [Bacteroidetes bacterium]|nr:Ig-like domain-containing protein [Bacteroidota bacterium]